MNKNNMQFSFNVPAILDYQSNNNNNNNNNNNWRYDDVDD